MHANLPLALLSPLVPSVLSRVGAEMGPTFWKLQKCAAFRQMHRYQLHVVLVVAFSFLEQNGAPAEKWKMAASGGRRRYRRHFAQPLGMRVAGSDACAQRPRFFKNGKRPPKWKRYHPHIVQLLACCVLTTYIFFIFQNLEEIDSCARESTTGTTSLL